MSKYYFVGSGIAALAGAAYLIRDGNVAGSDIVLLEESDDFGGALDAHGDSTSGYFMSGSRMFEHEYRCTFDLLSSIPSTSDPELSVTAETDVANGGAPWYNRARLVDRRGDIVDAHPLGFSEHDRVAILALMAKPESWLDSKSISDCFPQDFFRTNFWFEWCTLFAFQPWHSAIEFRRYLLRFLHHFSTIDTQEGVYRTLYNQYDSIAVPLVTWLRANGVTIRFNETVTDLGFTDDKERITVGSIELMSRGESQTISLSESDAVFVTIGSMTADKSFGSTVTSPMIDRRKNSGAWRLWETLAKDRLSFGKPATFDAHIDQSLWESFTVTDGSPAFFDRMRTFSGSEAGRGGLITFKDSSWLITLSIFGQPFFRNQSKEAFVWWGYGLFNNKRGDYVHKTMAECTGSEILEEVLGHLHFDDVKEAVLASSNVIPCMMPYITSQFLVRAAGDRPNVVPDTSTNLAFLGQFSEMPDDVVFTVEYSIRSAQTAVYTLLKLDRKPLPVYKGAHDPKVLLEAFETLHR
jgi:oleate hydratase